MVAVVVVAGAVAGGLALSRSSPSTSPPTTAVAPSTTPTSAVPSTTTSPPTTQPAVTAVSVVRCPTTEGVPPSTTTTAPATVAVAGVPSTLAGQISVYTDALGILRIIAPHGWTCQALVGADGSANLWAVPPGQNATQPRPFAPSDQEAVAAAETSACAGCTLGQACPLFPGAATAYQSSFGEPCPATRPPAEQVETISSTALLFEDPAGVAGDGSPSGGPAPANGVMTYNPANVNGSYLLTCTLPTAQHALCTLALNDFVVRYGSD